MKIQIKRFTVALDHVINATIFSASKVLLIHESWAHRI